MCSRSRRIHLSVHSHTFAMMMTSHKTKIAAAHDDDLINLKAIKLVLQVPHHISQQDDKCASINMNFRKKRLAEHTSMFDQKNIYA